MADGRPLEVWAREVVQALAGGRDRDALARLDAAPPGLEQRPALVARAAAWEAQAALGAGQLDRASAAIRRALKAARAVGDEAALPALRALYQQVAAARAAPATAAAAGAPASNGTQGLLEQAVDALDRGDQLAGERLARAALAQGAGAADARQQVLAWLALARLPGQAEASIRAAAAVADDASEPNLVAAVARAARAAGVDLGVHVF